MKLLLVLSLASWLHAAELKLGKPLTLSQPTPISTLLDNPGVHLGKMVQVTGKITEVCQSMGCWMAIVDPESRNSIRVKVNDGDIVFPKDAAGKRTVAEGTLTKIEMTRQQAAAYLKHLAEENGKRFDEASVTGPITVYQLAGTGAIIFD